MLTTESAVDAAVHHPSPSLSSSSSSSSSDAVNSIAGASAGADVVEVLADSCDEPGESITDESHVDDDDDKRGTEALHADSSDQPPADSSDQPPADSLRSLSCSLLIHVARRASL